MTEEAVAALDPKEIMSTLVEKLGNGATSYDGTSLLWQAHSPWVIGWILGVIGLASLVGMSLAYRKPKGGDEIRP